MTGYVATIGRHAAVFSPISAGHFMSHMYHTCLPSLFPLLHTELGISFAALGFIMTVFNLTTGAALLPIGYLIDRFGAVSLLIGGLVLEASAILFMGFSIEYAALLGLALVAGLGHAVFHPADYSILSAHIEENSIGRAFSIHTFSGHLGNAAAPALFGLLLLIFDWRQTLVIAGFIGFPVMAWLAIVSPRLSTRSSRTSGPRDTELIKENTVPTGFSSLFTKPMILLFLFFIVTAFTSNGIRAFSVSVFGFTQGLSTSSAAGLLSSYLFASALGVLAGGMIVDRIKRHDLMAAAGFSVAAIVMVMFSAVPMPVVVIGVLFTLVGGIQGAIRPARDMMVRAATPPGGMGKAFGFVSTGISIGGAAAPVLFGWLVDQGNPEWVFYSIAIFMGFGIISIMGSQRASSRVAIQNGGGDR